MLSTFLNVEGFLGRDFRFDVKRMMESRFQLAAKSDQRSGSIDAELRDSQGGVLLRQACEHWFPEGCARSTGLGTAGWLRMSIPRHPDAAELLLVRAERVLWRQAIAGNAPLVNLGASTVTADKVTLKVSVTPPQATIEILLIDERGHAYPVSEVVSDGSLTVALGTYAGSGQSHLRVSATIELRTNFADSMPFATPVPMFSGRIIVPRQGEELAPNQPLSLIGNVSIAQNGRPLDWAEAKPTWLLDGVAQLSRGDCIAVDALKPGEHVIELRQGGGARARLLHKVTVKVREPSALEAELAEAMRRVDAARVRRVVPPMSAQGAPRKTLGGKRRAGVRAPCKCC